MTTGIKSWSKLEGWVSFGLGQKTNETDGERGGDGAAQGINPGGQVALLLVGKSGRRVPGSASPPRQTEPGSHGGLPRRAGTRLAFWKIQNQ